MDWFLNLRWWIARCSGCRNRRESFMDGLCFDCWHSAMQAKVWRDLGEALAALIRAGALFFLEGSLRVNAVKAAAVVRRRKGRV